MDRILYFRMVLRVRMYHFLTNDIACDIALLSAQIVYSNGQVAIHPRFNNLITAPRTAVENGEGVLDKDASSHDDLMDVFRMSLIFWH